MAVQSSGIPTTAPRFVPSANDFCCVTAGDGDEAANLHRQDSHSDRRHRKQIFI